MPRATKHRPAMLRPWGMRPHLAALLGLIVAATSACAAPAAAADVAIANVPRASADPALATDAASAIDAFGIDLYRRSAKDENLVFSPASIAIALGMARVGAAGSTATEMDTVLHDLASDDHAGWLNALDAAFASRSGSFDVNGEQQSVSLRIANAPFAQRGTTFADGYLPALATRFGAGVRLVDYAGDTEGARTAINEWVAGQTEQRIPELLAKGSVTKDALLTLVDAIYLKAAWATPFLEAETSDGVFTRPDDTTVDVAMMHGSSTRLYARGDGWQAVELPYAGNALAMTLIVPDDLTTFEASFDADRYRTITAALQPAVVDLTMPKFSIETQLDLQATLSAMGMPSAFDPSVADFSGIAKDLGLVISAVVHQANIDVDEKGTTAAAATAVVLVPTGAPVDAVTMTIRRPFLFAVRDLPTGAVVFLGRVADPSAKG